MRIKATLVALALSLISLTAFAASRHSRTRIEDSSDADYDVRAGAPISVETFNGAIRVHSGSDNRVHVTTKKYVATENDEDARAVMASLNVEISHENGGLTLRAPNERRDGVQVGIAFDITVPRSTDLTLLTTNGSIDVDDVRGNAKLHTTNGHIEVDRGAGSVDAETTNGAVRVALQEVTPGRPLRFITTNGGITLDLPQNLGADIEASTTNGTIHSDLPLVTNDIERTRMSGRVNGGGIDVRVRTTNGSIVIR